MRSKGDYERQSPTTTNLSSSGRRAPISYQDRGASKQTLGEIDGALKDINEAIRVDPALPQPHRPARSGGDLDHAIADTTEAIRLATKAKVPVNIMTPPGSVLISAYTPRGLAYEAKGRHATLAAVARDAGSKANQATAKVRLSLQSEADTPRAAPPSFSTPT